MRARGAYLPVLGADDEHRSLVVGAATQRLRIQTANLFRLVFVDRLFRLQNTRVQSADGLYEASARTAESHRPFHPFDLFPPPISFVSFSLLTDGRSKFVLSFLS